MPKQEKTIFKRGSTTYYFSSKFFPRKVRHDVFRLYSFVRVADDYVDEQPAQPKKLEELENRYKAAIADTNFESITHDWDDIDTRVVKNMVQVSRKYKFDPAWVPAFLEAMKSDITAKPRASIESSLEYVYGSAEVIGLMMAKIMKLPDEAFHAAKLQGRAMQWINFVRDIAEDNDLGRQYIPSADLKKFGLKDLREETARANPEAFKKLIKLQIKRYRDWQKEASEGFSYISRRLRVPLETAADMYNWTADEIEKDPFIVFTKKVKPRKRRVLIKASRNTIKPR